MVAPIMGLLDTNPEMLACYMTTATVRNLIVQVRIVVCNVEVSRVSGTH